MENKEFYILVFITLIIILLFVFVIYNLYVISQAINENSERINRVYVALALDDTEEIDLDELEEFYKSKVEQVDQNSENIQSNSDAIADNKSSIESTQMQTDGNYEDISKNKEDIGVLSDGVLTNSTAIFENTEMLTKHGEKLDLIEVDQGKLLLSSGEGREYVDLKGSGMKIYNDGQYLGELGIGEDGAVFNLKSNMPMYLNSGENPVQILSSSLTLGQNGYSISMNGETQNFCFTNKDRDQIYENQDILNKIIPHPTVTFSSDRTDNVWKAGEVVKVFITLSEDSTDFSTESLDYPSEEITSFYGDGKDYVTTLEPGTRYGKLEMTIPSNSFSDINGFYNDKSFTFSFIYEDPNATQITVESDLEPVLYTNRNSVHMSFNFAINSFLKIEQIMLENGRIENYYGSGWKKYEFDLIATGPGIVKAWVPYGVVISDTGTPNEYSEYSYNYAPE